MAKKLSAKAIKKKRSLAAIKGWITRRKNEAKRKRTVQKRPVKAISKDKSKKTIARLKEKLRKEKARTRERLRRTKNEIQDLKGELKLQKGYVKWLKKIDKEAEEAAQVLTDRYAKHMRLDNLPPRQVNESAKQHAGRIIQQLKIEGWSVENAYSEVAGHTGVSPTEVYTMFMSEFMDAGAYPV
jgi:hypothetical protein